MLPALPVSGLPTQVIAQQTGAAAGSASSANPLAMLAAVQNPAMSIPSKIVGRKRKAGPGDYGRGKGGRGKGHGRGGGGVESSGGVGKK